MGGIRPEESHAEAGAPFWSRDLEELFRELSATRVGLSESDAQERLKLYGSNQLQARGPSRTLRLLLSQFRSPIILLLLLAAILAFFLGDTTEATIILIIVIASGMLSFWQEHGASKVMERLLTLVQVTTTVLRDGAPSELPLEQIVPGDLVLLAAGSVIPADCRLVESKDLFVNEATLTGEAYPVEKETGTLPAATGLGRRTNSVFMGTHVVSGEAKALAIRTGIGTEFGAISDRLRLAPPRTDFERGVYSFGFFLMRITFALVIGIFAVNLLLHRPLLDSLLFSLALAVGLTPQLLPAIISINLAQGARRMANHEVIVKRLSSIENFGSMNVLCTDKTGTLTEGVLQLARVCDASGRESERVLLHAYLNAALQTGYDNPFDAAIRDYRSFDLSAYRKLDEIPYDFNRKRLTILVAGPGENLMVSKGALGRILEVCSTVEEPDGGRIELGVRRQQIEDLGREVGEEGYRVLGVAIRPVGKQERIEKADEREMTLLGLLAVFDPVRSDAGPALTRLTSLGVSLKIISGDSAPVVRHVARQIGLNDVQLLSGAEVRQLSPVQLAIRASAVHAFAEIEPDQKEQIVTALQASGNVIGYLGDGINDAPALRAADVGISVQQAVSVAKDAADMVLLRSDLVVLADGVREGRRAFANTMKYIFMATSANFGNMFSMAGASVFMPFLPLLPGQILLTNLLTDLPEMTIATDRIDPEMVSSPRRWDVHFIRAFMFCFGLLSSLFDSITFLVLLLFLHAPAPLFRAGWFVESVLSASIIVLVIRSRRPFLTSRPSRFLLLSTAFTILVTLALPYSPVGGLLGFVPLPATFLLALAGILVLYILFAELLKRVFYRRFGSGGELPHEPALTPASAS